MAVSAAAAPLVDVNLERMYTAVLRENWTQHELDAIASSETLQRRLEGIKEVVWRPSDEEMTLYVTKKANEALRKQIKYHLEVDQSKAAIKWVKDYALLKLYEEIMA
jgi:L-serine deaminase